MNKSEYGVSFSDKEEDLFLTKKLENTEMLLHFRFVPRRISPHICEECDAYSYCDQIEHCSSIRCLPSSRKDKQSGIWQKIKNAKRFLVSQKEWESKNNLKKIHSCQDCFYHSRKHSGEYCELLENECIDLQFNFLKEQCICDRFVLEQKMRLS